MVVEDRAVAGHRAVQCVAGLAAVKPHLRPVQEARETIDQAVCHHAGVAEHPVERPGACPRRGSHV